MLGMEDHSIYHCRDYRNQAGVNPNSQGQRSGWCIRSVESVASNFGIVGAFVITFFCPARIRSLQEWFNGFNRLNDFMETTTEANESNKRMTTT